jgi:hypothetical protein
MHKYVHLHYSPPDTHHPHHAHSLTSKPAQTARLHTPRTHHRSRPDPHTITTHALCSGLPCAHGLTAATARGQVFQHARLQTEFKAHLLPEQEPPPPRPSDSAQGSREGGKVELTGSASKRAGPRAASPALAHCNPASPRRKCRRPRRAPAGRPPPSPASAKAAAAAATGEGKTSGTGPRALPGPAAPSCLERAANSGRGYCEVPDGPRREGTRGGSSPN